ncbi:3-hydroxypropionyl-coenzyme A dehydratase [Acrasis kona]|uniref:3-hydroxypropionyl-coenzyme A dehydratase n=1 Tax=Acrasis kona TaxID=1008807 RepID=A0AAW2ZF71_9EUKA
MERIQVLRGHFLVKEPTVGVETEANGWKIDFVHVESEQTPDAILVTMNSNKVNAIGDRFCHDFRNCLKRLDSYPFNIYPHLPLLIQSEPNSKNFCAGFDLVDLSKAASGGKESLLNWLRRSDDIFETLYMLPRPTVAIINGNAIAGGMVIAMCCDFRVIVQKEDKVIMSLKEIALGLPFPYKALEIIRMTTSGSTLFEATLTGREFNPQECLEYGLVNRVTSGDPIKECMDLINKRFDTKKGHQAYVSIKHALKRGFPYRDELYQDKVTRQVEDLFTSPQVISAMSNALRRNAKI